LSRRYICCAPLSIGEASDRCQQQQNEPGWF
jgi:hypothetical protein